MAASCWWENSPGSLSAAAAPIIGVAKRNENLAESSCDRPTNKLPVMAEPVREKPGISASACMRPTLIDCIQFSFEIRSSLPVSVCSFLFLRIISAVARSKPLIISTTDTICGEANRFFSECSKISPNNPAGIVPTISNQPSLA